MNKMKRSKKAIMGETLTLLVVSFIVLLILEIFSFAAGVFPKSQEVILEEKGFLVEEDLRPLFESLVMVDGQSVTISDLMLLYSIDDEFKDQLKQEIEKSLQLSYGKCYSFRIQTESRVLEERWETGDSSPETTAYLPNRVEFQFKNTYSQCLLEEKDFDVCDARCN